MARFLGGLQNFDPVVQIFEFEINQQKMQNVRMKH